MVVIVWKANIWIIVILIVTLQLECDVNDTDNYKDFIELVEELDKKLDQNYFEFKVRRFKFYEKNYFNVNYD